MLSQENWSVIIYSMKEWNTTFLKENTNPFLDKAEYLLS